MNSRQEGQGITQRPWHIRHCVADTVSIIVNDTNPFALQTGHGMEPTPSHCSQPSFPLPSTIRARSAGRAFGTSFPPESVTSPALSLSPLWSPSPLEEDGALESNENGPCLPEGRLPEYDVDLRSRLRTGVTGATTTLCLLCLPTRYFTGTKGRNVADPLALCTGTSGTKADVRPSSHITTQLRGQVGANLFASRSQPVCKRKPNFPFHFPATQYHDLS